MSRRKKRNTIGKERNVRLKERKSRDVLDEVCEGSKRESQGGKYRRKV